MNNTMVIKDTPFSVVKREALEQAKESYLRRHNRRLTQEMIHVQTGIPLSNVNRYFNDPEYNPGPENLALICNAMQNWLMIDWIAAQGGGIFVRRPDERHGRQEHITCSVNKIQRGASDLLAGALEALKDGNLTVEELRGLIALFRNMATSAEEGLRAVEQAAKAPEA